MAKPSVTRLKAVRRSPLAQWWLDNKRVVKPMAIALAVVLAIIWLLYELIRVANGL